MDLPIPFDANGLETVSMALQNRMMTLVAFSASSELLQFARLVAASGDDARFPDAGILPAHRGHAGGTAGAIHT
jgi:hypothetical protein